MPTKARFGRLPRAAPSLTSTIVALAQEYQRVRESNIVDAWKNGGQFEGKKVTDDDIMKWMKARRNELDPSDPKWDYYNNQLVQYDFAIENSKMELSYKRGKTSDMGMVAFYHKWSAKLPKDSEAYREREKLAAAYADRAQSGRAAGGRARSDKAYVDRVNSAYKKEFAYDATLAFLTEEAHNRGIIRGTETLENIDPMSADGHEINRLWDEINTSPEYAEDRAYWTKQIRDKGDPNFNGDFSQDGFNGQKRTKMSAVDDRIKAARAAGRKEDTGNFIKDKDTVRGTTIMTGGWDETELYEDVHGEWLQTFANNPNATALEIDRATEKYKVQLNQIKDRLEANIKPGEHDDRIGWVYNELRTLDGDEAPVEHWGGSKGPGENTGMGEATKTAMGVKQTKQDLANLTLRDANGDPLFVQMKVDNKGMPSATNVDNHFGSAWGVVRRENLDPNAVYVVQGDPGDPRADQIMTAVMPTPVFVASDVRDEDGVVGPKKNPTPSAYYYTMPDGKVGYKYKDGAGKWLYTPDNPFGTINPDGTFTPNPPKITGDGGTVMVPSANGVVPAGDSTAILPSYYNPGANTAMTSRIAKSGYSMWLIASDPKDKAAYATKPDAIIRAMKLEAGGDMGRLAEMVEDADNHRAIYLGTHTEEQNRIRANAISGSPNPVSLADVMPKYGVTGPSKEQKLVTGLESGARSLVAGTAAAARGEDLTRHFATPLSADEIDRKYNMVPTPPSPLGAPKVAPTSLGSDIPGNIASSLIATIQGLTGNKAVIPAAPKATGPAAGPTATTRPVYNQPPTPTAPSPVAPTPRLPNRAEQEDLTKPTPTPTPLAPVIRPHPYNQYGPGK